MFDVNSLPKNIFCCMHSGSHVQGIAFDKEHKHVYISFTTRFVKADMDGNIIGTVNGITGHLGCIDFNDEDGKVYGSIEYKHDSIGKGIINRIGASLADEDAFYIAIFDVDKIDRMDMDAEKDGVMTAVYLPDVLADYSYNEGGVKHRFGCSGIDGTTIGRVPGAPEGSPSMLMVAYGIYGDLERHDNDCQVILQYDWRKFADVAKPLSQLEPHHEGLPFDERYFVYTGNTTYGIQNLEYDAYTGDYFAAVYEGQKPQFPNYRLFVIDGSAEPTEVEGGKMLSLKKIGLFDEKSGTCGYYFDYGDTGLYSLGNGYFYISHHGHPEKGVYLTNIKLYKYNEKDPFELV